MGEGHCKVSLLFFPHLRCRNCIELQEPQKLFKENSWPIYGNLCSPKKMKREILAIFSPNPQGERKERSVATEKVDTGR